MKQNDTEKKQTNLRKLRKEQGKGYTQESMAEEIGCGIKSLYTWETGKGHPDTDNLIRIADRFGVSTDYILNRTDFRSPEKSFIGEYTGLSDRAIEVLHYLSAGTQDSHKENLEVLNYILENQFITEAPQGQLSLVGVFSPGKVDYYGSPESPLLKNTDNLLHFVRKCLMTASPDKNGEKSVMRFADGEKEEIRDLVLQHYLNRITGMIMKMRDEGSFLSWLKNDR